MSQTPTIETGMYWVTATCPQCGQDEVIPVNLMPRLERTPEDSTISVKVAQKKAAHRCGQTSITVVSETGEITGQIELGP